MAHSSPYPFLLFTALVVFTLSTLAQNTVNIPVGSSLTATENSNAWRSPSGDFAFGFQQLRDNRDLFVLSIWLDKIPDKTIVWYLRSVDPVAVPRGSKLRLDSTDGLVLQDPQGWLFYTADGAAYASISDTGNFLLFRSDSSILWESFRNPTDTILPTQTLEIGGNLTSRKTETNFSQGRFYASMNSCGNFIFKAKEEPSNSDVDYEYYNSHTSDQNASNSGYRLVFNERASISVVRRDEEPLITLTPPSIPSPSENYYRATLDSDGVLTQYYHPKNFGSNPRWTPVKSWPDHNICVSIDGDKGSGFCGYNNVCRLENQRPVCQCLQGFTLADPSDAYSNCTTNYVQNCDQGEKGSAEDEELLELADIDLPKNDYEQISTSTEKQCRRACLKDCLCAAAIYRDNSCWKKKLPLSYGRVNTTLNSKAFIKYRKGPGNNKLKKTILLIGGVSVTALSATSIILFILFRKKYTLVPKWPILQQVETGRVQEIELFFKNNPNLALKRYRFSDLKNMTKSLSDKLGKGGYGSVYKGKLTDGRLVAVKVLNESNEDGEEFMNELVSISRTSHINVVTLLGFCFEGSKRALIYDFMPNGSLEKFILNTTSSSAVLGWKKLFEIAVGIARGLEYLHQGCNTRILHFDIKPHNILLDKDFNPKISDFGLAKLCPNRSSIVSMLVARGTIGYIAPEVFSRSFGEVSYKSDVYSYGMMVLEMTGGRKNIDPKDVDRTSEIYFPNYIYKQLEMGAKTDGSLAGVMNEEERQFVNKLIIVGLWCIQTDPSNRPSMTKVIEMLEGKLELLQVPPKPYLSSPPRSVPIVSTSESMQIRCEI